MPYVTLKNGNRLELVDEFTGENKSITLNKEKETLDVNFGTLGKTIEIGSAAQAETDAQKALVDAANAQAKADSAYDLAGVADGKADDASALANTKLAKSGHLASSVIVADENGTLQDNFITDDNVANGAAIASSKILFSQAESNALNSGVTSSVVSQVSANEAEINAINAKIPAQASEQNQLADRDFVNSTAASATSTFRGTYNSLQELEAYSGPKDNNDYAFVIATDQQGNTVYNRYKYDGSAWVFEYALNNSSFTAAQWATINSGATSGTVTQVETNRTNIVVNTNKINTLNGSASTQGSVANKIATALPTAGDGNTIDANTNGKLEAIGLLNANGGALIKVWEGSESAWENGKTNDWFGWSNTSMTTTVDNDRLPSAMPTGYTQMVYGTSRLFCISNNNTFYSDDNGATWNIGGVIQGSSQNASHFIYHNGTFFAINYYGEVWSCAESSSEWTYLGHSGTGYVTSVTSNDNKIFILSTSSDSPYTRLSVSSDNGASWSAVSSSVLDSLPNRGGGGANIDAFGDVILITHLNQAIYSTDNGVTWQSSGDIAGGSIPSNINWKLMHTPSGRFIADYIGNIVYSDDNGVTWEEGAYFPKTTYGDVMKDLNGTLVIGDGNRFYTGNYNLTSWTLVYTLPSNTYCRYPAVCGNKLVGCVEQTHNMLTLANVTTVLYTDSTTVTSKSPVYSEPEVVSSEYKITYQVGNTLNVTDLATQKFVDFTRDSQSDQATTSSVGDIHPDWLCNIENVGVKFGNKLIADASGSLVVDQVYDATSPNAQSGIAIADAEFAPRSLLATVGITGNYDDLLNKPTIPAITDTYSAESSDGMSGKAVASAISGKADSSGLAVVATSGDYNDLSNKPEIPAAPIWGNIAGTLENQVDLLNALSNKVDYNYLLTNNYLQNQASNPNSLSIGSDSSANGVVSLGKYQNSLEEDSVVIGDYSSSAANEGLALGRSAVIGASATNAIQIGRGTNNEPRTLYVGGLSNGTNVNYKLLDLADGLIPDARLSSNIARTASIPTVDQTYSASSTNAQSGVAVAQAVAAAGSSKSDCFVRTFTTQLSNWTNTTDSTIAATYPMQATNSLELLTIPYKSTNKVSAYAVFSAADAMSGKYAPFAKVVSENRNPNQGVQITIYATETPAAGNQPTLDVTVFLEYGA